MKKLFKKAALVSALTCAFITATPQEANAIQTNWEHQTHVAKIVGIRYEFLGHATDYFMIVHLETRDGQRFSNVYDRNGNFVNSASGWL